MNSWAQGLKNVTAILKNGSFHSFADSPFQMTIEWGFHAVNLDKKLLNICPEIWQEYNSLLLFWTFGDILPYN